MNSLTKTIIISSLILGLIAAWPTAGQGRSRAPALLAPVPIRTGPFSFEVKVPAEIESGRLVRFIIDLPSGLPVQEVMVTAEGLVVSHQSPDATGFVSGIATTEPVTGRLTVRVIDARGRAVEVNRPITVMPTGPRANGHAPKAEAEADTSAPPLPRPTTAPPPPPAPTPAKAAPKPTPARPAAADDRQAMPEPTPAAPPQAEADLKPPYVPVELRPELALPHLAQPPRSCSPVDDRVIYPPDLRLTLPSVTGRAGPTAEAMADQMESLGYRSVELITNYDADHRPRERFWAYRDPAGNLIRHGRYQELSRGRLARTAVYLDGLLHGRVEEFDPDAPADHPSRIIEYRHGRKNGREVLLDVNGAPIRTIEYRHGRLCQDVRIGPEPMTVWHEWDPDTGRRVRSVTRKNNQWQIIYWDATGLKPFQAIDIKQAYDRDGIVELEIVHLYDESGRVLEVKENDRRRIWP